MSLRFTALFSSSDITTVVILDICIYLVLKVTIYIVGRFRSVNLLDLLLK